MSTTQRMQRAPGWLATAAAAFLLGGTGCGGQAATLESTSPDGTWTVRLRELGSSIDRNFVVEVASVRGGGHAEVFRSPDEGRPIGSERFLWTGDSRFVFLAGEQFFVEPRIAVAAEGDAYLLVELASGEVWCNAQQIEGARITGEQLRALGFRVDE